MKKYFYIFLIAITSICCATTYQENKNPIIKYMNLRSMGGLPMVGAGIRTQTGIYNLDLSANICPTDLPKTLSIFHVRGLCLIYPKQLGFYFGGGLGMLNQPETIKISSSFETAIGFQWPNKFFLEIDATCPMKHTHNINPIWPCLTLGYGF